MVQNINPTELIEKTAEELKKITELKPPVWAYYVKTGVNKERAPIRNDWWYVRTAAILRSIYILGPIGVSKLRTKYGGKRNKGHKPDRVYKSSGNIIRKILQQLEKTGFLTEEKKGIHKGRKITKKGKEFLDNISKQIKPEVRIEKAEKEEVKENKKEVKVEKEAKKREIKKKEMKDEGKKPEEKESKKEGEKKENGKV